MKDHANRFPRNGYLSDPAKPVTVEPDCSLTIQDLVAVARGDGKGGCAPVELGGDWVKRCTRTQEYIRSLRETVVELWAQLEGIENPSERGNRVREFCRKTGIAETDNEQALLIYGVLTGFGSNKTRLLTSDEDIRRLQINLLRSHASGMGAPLPTEVVRAMMLLRVRTFVQGHSGVRPEIVQLLVDMLNKRVHPWVPEQGSVGSSGDLCPLSHLSLVLLGEGYAWVGDGPAGPVYRPPAGDAQPWDVRAESRPMPLSGKDALARAGLEPVARSDNADGIPLLEAKEGLALINGTALATALAAIAVYDADMLAGAANISGAATLQAILGFTRALDPVVHEVRGHDGQTQAAAQIRQVIAGSTMLNLTSDVQDSYSVRCMPPVHGAAIAAIEHVWHVIECELNSVTDNPLFFIDKHLDSLDPKEDPLTCVWRAFSAGNFHGEPVGMATDYLKIAVAELANISERRVQLLYDSNYNRGLPANLACGKPGLNSGFMTAQYAAASLVSENKVLSHPASVDSIPTSSNIEDHVAMAPIAGRHARIIIDNARNVIAIETISALQAIELRFDDRVPGRIEGTLEERVSPAVLRLWKTLREGKPAVPFLEDDRELWSMVATVSASVRDGGVLRAILG
ncbi:MAG: aromatic amino acid lyase [bacterium]|nr:aromatic amino acid lyase [bacterium]